MTTTQTPRPKLSRSICVFCGASNAVDKSYFDLANQTGKAIAKHGLQLVYGGGGVGLMGETARSAYKSGGQVLGVIPEFLTEFEDMLPEIEHLIVANMRERKQEMYNAADAFIVLPGGVGTLEEAIEVMSWMRLHLHSKPMVFLDTDGYWAPLIELLLHTIETKFSPAWLTDHIIHTRSIDEAMTIIQNEWKNPTLKGDIQVM